MNRVGVFGQISEINDHLFLSGAGVLKPEKIRQKRISMIVNATTEEPCTYLEGKGSLTFRGRGAKNAGEWPGVKATAVGIQDSKQRIPQINNESPFLGVDSIKIRVDDHPYARLSEHFDSVADKIKATKERGGKTLVHCMVRPPFLPTSNPPNSGRRL